MPIPKITSALINSTKECLPGWSLFTLHEAPRANKAQKGNSVNYFFKFEAQSGPLNSDENKGRLVTLMISAGALEAGISNVCATYYGMLSALTGLSGEELVDKEIDDNALVGKSLWVDLDWDVQEGKKYANFKQMSPATEIPF